MKYGLRLRNTRLVPLSEATLNWVHDILNEPEVWEEFGFIGPAGRRFRHHYRKGHLVAGIIEKVGELEPIGFVVMFPPSGDLDFWEFGYAIPNAKHRDAFTAMNATDLMAHYMFDHLRVDALGWRTRVGNRQADAVVRRLGYTPSASWEIDDKWYTFYRLDRPGWAKRRARVERAQRANDEGPAFVRLRAPKAPLSRTTEFSPPVGSVGPKPPRRAPTPAMLSAG